MDSRLFLTSSAHLVAEDLGRKLDTASRRIKLLFIETAAEIEEGDKQWLLDDREALVKAGFVIKNYTITDKKAGEIEEEIEKHDVIYVSGGDTFYLLYQSQQCGFADLIKKAVSLGKIYVGTSAGSIIAGPDIYPIYKLESKEWMEKVAGYEGYGLVDVVIFPHWGSEHFKDLYLDKRLEPAYDVNHKYILLNDYQYMEVSSNDNYKIVDVRDDKKNEL